MSSLRRSILSVPGHIEKMHHKASISQADVIMLDLEDSVPVDKKSEARKQVVRSLREIDWGTKIVTVRVNGFDTPWFYDDTIFVMEKCADKIDSLVIPKVDSVSDVHFYDHLLNGIEYKLASSKKTGLEISIESAAGLNNIFEIANASERIKTLVFGIADFSSSIGARLVSISGHGENEEEIYPGHRWNYVLSRIVTAAKANNLTAVDAAYGNFKDEEGLKKSCALSIALGFEGKWAIHPAQIKIINELYSPGAEEIELAKKIVKAEQEAINAGLGAVSIDGRMVDRATIRLAKKQLEKQRLIEEHK